MNIIMVSDIPRVSVFGKASGTSFSQGGFKK